MLVVVARAGCACTLRVCVHLRGATGAAHRPWLLICGDAMLLLQLDESDSLSIFPERTGMLTTAARYASSATGVRAEFENDQKLLLRRRD